MTPELLRAFAVILEFCLAQNDCRTCPMKAMCAKMPCEW